MRKKKKTKEAKNYTQALREKPSENFLTFVLQQGKRTEFLHVLLDIYESTSQYPLFDKSVPLSLSFFHWKYRQEIVGKMQRRF